jgi:hypothetical protein
MGLRTWLTIYDDVMRQVRRCSVPNGSFQLATFGEPFAVCTRRSRAALPQRAGAVACA